MPRMIALSQCYSVTGIPEWGRRMSGRKQPCLGNHKTDVADDQQIIPVVP